MLTLMKWLIGIVLLAVLALGVVLFLVPAKTFKPMIQTALSEALDREVRIDGDISWQVWPPLSLQVHQLRVANLGGAMPAEMLRVEKVDMAIDLLDYVAGTLRIQRLHLVSPDVRLRRLADGRVNWNFGGGEGEAIEPATDGVATAAFDSPKLVIADVQITGGSFEYADDMAGIGHVASDIEVGLNQDGDALVLSGMALYNDETVRVTGQIDDLNAAATGQATDIRASLDSAPLSASLGGRMGAVQADEMRLEAHVPNLEHLLGWLQLQFDLPPETPSTLALEASLNATPAAIAVTAFELAASPWSLAGSARLDIADRPKLQALIDLGEIDLSPWTDRPAPPSDAPASDAAGEAGWPDEPIDLPLPLPLDIDLSIGFASIDASPLQIGAGSVGLYADNLSARLEIPELALYDGKASAGLAIGDLDLGPSYALRGTLTGVDAGPLLQALADFDRLEGRVNLQTELATSGASVKALVEGLAGEGDWLFRDGAILGINIAATMRRISSLGLGQEAAGERRTDFAEMGGSFVIEQGVVSNDDLQLRAPILRLAGAGTVDLPAQELDYALTPRLSATLEGQDAAAEPVVGAGIPIVVSGPWADPQFQLAIGGTLSGDLRDPESVAQLVANLGSDPAQLAQLREQFGAGEGDGALPVLDALLGGNGDQVSPGEALKEQIGDAKDGIDRLKDGLGGLLKR